ncbi:ATP-binding protein [Streptosporangium sp. NPDC000396]|uniref:ATP-binding protein n=1 Tax=Streptosporangium sp. NPDC000396 TaxID=3366185 RepID=UPI00367E4DF8
MNLLPARADQRTSTPHPRTSPSIIQEKPHTRAWRRCKAVLHRLGVGSTPGNRRASWLLAPEPYSVRRARRLTSARLTEWGLDEQSPIAELLVSELVTNAMYHARGRITLTLSLQEGLLRCEVEDADPVLPRPHLAHHDEEGGRGLHLIELLSCCWGSARTPTGKAVWFELPAQAPAEIES